MVACALREIRYYQSARMADKLLIPYKKFVMLVRELQQDILEEHVGLVKAVDGKYRWEKDALVALQTMTEHVMVMIFEMTYVLLLFN